MTAALDERRSIVVTGIGSVSVWGWDSKRLWRGLLAGETGIAPTRRFDTDGQRTRIAGEVPPAPAATAGRFDAWGEYSRADRFAVAATDEACRQADLPTASTTAPDPELGVFFGTSTAGMAEGEAFFHHLRNGSRRRARLRLVAAHPLNSPGDAVARLLDAGGPVRSFSSACASGAVAIGAALDALREGEVDLAVAGGADSLCRLTYAGFNALRVVDPRPCRPFRHDRQGLTLGEGAGVLVLERRARAEARGAAVLAELRGAGGSCDAHHMTAPHPRGEGAALALERALADAALAPSEIDVLNAHGTGTPHNDASEWCAVERVFGPRARRLAVTATKGSVGHLLGASGAIEAVATVLCLVAGEIPPTPGDGSLDEALAVDLVTGAPRPLERPADRPPHAVSTSFGFGGANAALVFAGSARERPA